MVGIRVFGVVTPELNFRSRFYGDGYAFRYNGAVLDNIIIILGERHILYNLARKNDAVSYGKRDCAFCRVSAVIRIVKPVAESYRYVKIYDIIVRAIVRNFYDERIFNARVCPAVIAG